MAKTPTGRTNQEAYATYRSFVEPEVPNTAVKNQLPSSFFQGRTQYLLIRLVGYWSARYYRRMEAIHRWKADDLDPVLGDTEAKDVLVARHRTRNAPYGIPVEFTGEQLAVLRPDASFRLLDVSSLTDIPSYGPSMISLWTDAKNAGLSDDDAAESIFEWQYYRPPSWARDDERQAKKLPMIDQAVQARLNQRVIWRRTGDLFIPWTSQVDGETWEVRINDFPDEYMYSLLIDGALIGDFHDWPAKWDRSAKPVEAPAPPKPSVAPLLVDAATLVARYQAGECEAVWRDLVALGIEVRKPAYAAAAESVVKETMRRVRHNFELIVERLQSIGYQFHGGVSWAPELKEDPKLIAACEHEGLFLPLSLRAFVEQLGAITLLGTHARLAPQGVETDALMIGGPQVLDGTLEEWTETAPEDRTSVLYEICTDAESKLGILDNEEPGNLFCIEIPNGSADSVLVGEPEGRTLVEYLRRSFQWGGFPGWESQKSRPKKELALLREGLLPI